MAFVFAGGFPILHSGAVDAGTYTEFVIDSAFVLGTSGDAMIWGFIAPEAQSSAALTIYAYIGAVTGSPTDFRADIYAEPGSPADKDRPEGSPIATSSATDLSSLADSWATFSIASVSLTKDAWYWLVIRNATGTPGSNYAALISRPALDLSDAAYRAILVGVRNGTTTNGVTSDPSDAGYVAACVIKMDSGTKFGSPYARNRTYLGNNAHDRGMRVIFPEDVVLIGVGFSTNNTLRDLKIYLTGTGTQVGSTISHANNSRLQSENFWRVPKQTLTGGQGYDIVLDPDGSTGVGGIAPSMYQATPPADVAAMAPTVGGTKWASIAGATPGSYTYDARDLPSMFLYFDEASPEIAGGGGNVNLLVGKL